VGRDLGTTGATDHPASGPSLAEVELLGLVEAVRHVPVAVAVVDASGQIVYTNPRAQELTRQLGAPMPEQMSAGFEIHRLDGRLYAREEWPVARSIATGEHVVDEEYFHVLPDGGRLVVRANSAPVHDAEGQVVAAVLVMCDVTGDRQVAERLATFDRLLESTDDAVVGTDADFRVTLWNPGAERLYGYTADEVLGRPAREVATYQGDESRQRLEAELLEADRARTELTARRKGGTEVEVELVVAAVRNELGEIVGYLGVHRDISERKRRERERDRLASIIQNSADFIGIADVDGRVLFLNEAGRRMVGFGSGDVTRTDVFDYFAPADQARLRSTIVPRILEQGRWPADTELHLRHWLTNESIPVLWDAFRIDDPRTGEPMAIATVTRDITALKQAEQELARRARQQAAVATLGVQALAGADPQAVMDAAVRAVSRTLDVEHVALAELLPGGEELALRAGIGWREDAIGQATGSARDSLVGHTVAAGRPVISADVGADDRFERSPLLDELGPVSAVVVVIEGRDEPFGALAALGERGRRFTEGDVDFMQTVANVISVAFEAARTEERLLEVREGERRRIARDLHDEALQGLTTAIARARRVPARGEEVVDLLTNVGRQLRAAIYDLRLGADEDRTLAERLRELVAVQAGLAPRPAIRAEIAEGTPDVSGHCGTEVLRIVAEALTNARRHAEATEVHVRTWGSAETLRVEVADDGVGFALEQASSLAGSAGLRGMRERADLIDGRLEIRTEPGHGTVVRLALALSRPEQIRVLLVEDHATVREAIAGMLEREPDFSVVGQAGSLAEARELLEGVDIVLLDLGLPDGFGGDLIPELRRANPGAQALVLSAGLDRANLARAVQNGAAGAVDKVAHLDEVVEAARRLRAGETLVPLDELAELLRYDSRRREQEHADRLAIESLTPRELDILRALAEGRDSQSIAAHLHITLRTERNHVAHILAKLGVHSQLQALVFCLRYGVVKI
jgi:PAS domain S-box-containing protein